MSAGGAKPRPGAEPLHCLATAVSIQELAFRGRVAAFVDHVYVDGRGLDVVKAGCCEMRRSAEDFLFASPAVPAFTLVSRSAASAPVA